MNKEERFTIRLSSADKKTLKQVAKVNGQSMSDLVRSLVMNQLKYITNER